MTQDRNKNRAPADAGSDGDGGQSEQRTDAGREVGQPDLPQAAIKRIVEAAQSGDEREIADILRLYASFYYEFSGPIPHPDVLRRYDEILPGSAERIMSSMENQTTHRQNIERDTTKADIELRKNGQKYAVWIAFGALLTSLICAAIGAPWVAGTISFSVFGAIGAAGALNFYWERAPRRR